MRDAVIVNAATDTVAAVAADVAGGTSGTGTEDGVDQQWSAVILFVERK